MSRPGPFTGYGRPRRRDRSAPSQTPRRIVNGPPAPRKQDCAGHVAGVDDLGRWPIGDCGPGCLMRRYRLGLAEWDGKRWT